METIKQERQLKRLTIAFSQHERQKIREAAARAGLSSAGWIKTIIEEKLEKTRLKDKI